MLYAMKGREGPRCLLRYVLAATLLMPLLFGIASDVRAQPPHVDIPEVDRVWTPDLMTAQLNRWEGAWKGYSTLPSFEILEDTPAFEVQSLTLAERGFLMIEGEAVLFLQDSYVLVGDVPVDVRAGELVFVTQPIADDDTDNLYHCSVGPCDEGTSACCQAKIPGRLVARCRCWSDDSNFDTCDSGGKGARSCSVGKPTETRLGPP